MGLMTQLVGKRQRKTMEDYTELTLDGLDMESVDTGTQVHIAEIDGQQSAIDVKEAVLDGDIVVADISRLNSQNGGKHIIGDLERIANEVGGDIVQKGDSQLIVTPTGMSIPRDKLTS